MAKFGLKYTGITWEEWQRNFFVHIGTGDRKEAMDLANRTLYNWNK
jgi:hypothetical protein